MKVLIVEDEAEIRVCYVTLLKDLSLDVAAAANGVDALRIYRENPLAFCLVLTDGDMPEGNGVWLAREIRCLEFGQKVPLILISGDAEKYRNSSDAFLFTEVLEKPLIGREFGRLLKQYLP